MTKIFYNLSRILCLCVLVLSGFFSFLFITALYTTHEYNFPLLPLSIFFIALPVISLRSAVLIFTFLLPVFGNRPGSTQAFYLFFIAASLNAGACLSLLSRFKKFSTQINFNNPIIILTTLYVVCSAFSLTSLPLYELLNNFRGQFVSFGDFTAFSFLLTDLVTSTEEKISYSFLSLLWTLFSYNLMFTVYYLCKSDRKNLSHITNSIFASLMLTIIAGLLDYYSVINLESLRKLDPVVNPQNIQFRLQSFFGHSGWLAEFATLTIPFVLVILKLPFNFVSRLIIIIAILLLGEFTLILSFQRGGWVSYPMTLIVVWSAIYVFQKLETSSVNFISALKKSLLKIVISIPLTLLATFLIFSGLSKFNIVNTDRDAVISHYVNRFSDISRSSDRTDFMKAGFMIGKLYPILGAGSESFAYRFNREFNFPDGEYYRQLNLPLFGSSHNVYMQTFSGKGFYGLMLLLSLVWYIIYSSVKLALYETKNSRNEKLYLLSIASFCFAFLIYGNVQELFYIQVLQFLFFIVAGLAAALQADTLILKNKTIISLCLLTLFMILTHLVWVIYKYEPPSHNSANSEYGCYRIEKDHKNRHFRWCGPKSVQAFPYSEKADKKQIDITIETGLLRSGTEIMIYSGESLIYKQAAEKQKIYNISLDLPKEVSISNISNENKVLLKIVSNSYFIPARDYKRSKDRRLLAYKLYRDK